MLYPSSGRSPADDAIRELVEALSDPRPDDSLDAEDPNNLAGIAAALGAGLPAIAWGPARVNPGAGERVARARRQFEQTVARLLAALAAGAISLAALYAGIRASYRQQALNAYVAGRRSLGDLTPLTDPELAAFETLIAPDLRAIDDWGRREETAGPGPAAAPEPAAVEAGGALGAALGLLTWVQNAQMVGDLWGRISRRVSSLGSRLATSAIPGEMSALDKLPGDSVMVWWALGDADHCQDCIALSDGSPYYLSTLRDLGIFPGSGHTRCRYNCACRYRYDVPTEVCGDGPDLADVGTDPGLLAEGLVYVGSYGDRASAWLREATACRLPVGVDSLSPGTPEDLVDDASAFSWDADVAGAIEGGAVTDSPLIGEAIGEEGISLASTLGFLTREDPAGGFRWVDVDPESLRVLRYRLDDTAYAAAWHETSSSVVLDVGTTYRGASTLETDYTLRALHDLAAHAETVGKDLVVNGDLAGPGMRTWLETLGAGRRDTLPDLERAVRTGPPPLGQVGRAPLVAPPPLSPLNERLLASASEAFPPKPFDLFDDIRDADRIDPSSLRVGDKVVIDHYGKREVAEFTGMDPTAPLARRWRLADGSYYSDPVRDVYRLPEREFTEWSQETTAGAAAHKLADRFPGYQAREIVAHHAVDGSVDAIVVLGRPAVGATSLTQLSVLGATARDNDVALLRRLVRRAGDDLGRDVVHMAGWGESSAGNVLRAASRGTLVPVPEGFVAAKTAAEASTRIRALTSAGRIDAAFDLDSRNVILARLESMRGAGLDVSRIDGIAPVSGDMRAQGSHLGYDEASIDKGKIVIRLDPDVLDWTSYGAADLGDALAQTYAGATARLLTREQTHEVAGIWAKLSRETDGFAGLPSPTRYRYGEEQWFRDVVSTTTAPGYVAGTVRGDEEVWAVLSRAGVAPEVEREVPLPVIRVEATDRLASIGVLDEGTIGVHPDWLANPLGDPADELVDAVGSMWTEGLSSATRDALAPLAGGLSSDEMATILWREAIREPTALSTAEREWVDRALAERPEWRGVSERLRASSDPRVYLDGEIRPAAVSYRVEYASLDSIAREPERLPATYKLAGKWEAPSRDGSDLAVWDRGFVPPATREEGVDRLLRVLDLSAHEQSGAPYAARVKLEGWTRDLSDHQLAEVVQRWELLAAQGGRTDVVKELYDYKVGRYDAYRKITPDLRARSTGVCWPTGDGRAYIGLNDSATYSRLGESIYGGHTISQTLGDTAGHEMGHAITMNMSPSGQRALSDLRRSLDDGEVERQASRYAAKGQGHGAEWHEWAAETFQAVTRPGYVRGTLSWDEDFWRIVSRDTTWRRTDVWAVAEPRARYLVPRDEVGALRERLGPIPEARPEPVPGRRIGAGEPEAPEPLARGFGLDEDLLRTLDAGGVVDPFRAADAAGKTGVGISIEYDWAAGTRRARVEYRAVGLTKSDATAMEIYEVEGAGIPITTLDRTHLVLAAIARDVRAYDDLEEGARMVRVAVPLVERSARLDEVLRAAGGRVNAQGTYWVLEPSAAARVEEAVRTGRPLVREEALVPGAPVRTRIVERPPEAPLPGTATPGLRASASRYRFDADAFATALSADREIRLGGKAATRTTWTMPGAPGTVDVRWQRTPGSSSIRLYDVTGHADERTRTAAGLRQALRFADEAEADPTILTARFAGLSSAPATFRQALLDAGARQEGTSLVLDRPSLLRLRDELRVEPRVEPPPAVRAPERVSLEPVPEVAALPVAPDDLAGLTIDDPRARAALGGLDPKSIASGPDGNRWLLKKRGDYSSPTAESAASVLSARLGLRSPTVTTVDKGRRSIQSLIPGAASLDVELPRVINSAEYRDALWAALGPEGSSEVVRGALLDYAIGNRDATAYNLLRDGAGRVWTIDRGQAFRTFGRYESMADFYAGPSAAASLSSFGLLSKDPRRLLAEFHPRDLDATIARWRAMDVEETHRLATDAVRSYSVATDENVATTLARLDAAPDAWRTYFADLARREDAPEEWRTWLAGQEGSLQAVEREVPWPEPGTLTDVGPRASEALGGMAPKTVLRDAEGREWLYKPGALAGGRSRAAVDVADALGLPVPDERAWEYGGTRGSLQRLIPGARGVDSLSALTPDQLDQLAAHSVLDLLVANDDAHVGQWVVDAEGRLWGVDKAEAFASHVVRGGEPIFHDAMDEVWNGVAFGDPAAAGLGSIHPGTYERMLDRLDAIDDERYRALIGSAFASIENASLRAGAIAGYVARKHALRGRLHEFLERQIRDALAGPFADRVPAEWRAWYEEVAARGVAAA